MCLFGASAILLYREAKESGFRIKPFAGTLNVLYYYRKIRKDNKKVSLRFWIYVAANLNFFVLVVVFVPSLIWR
jgi:hypothetical protein